MGLAAAAVLAAVIGWSPTGLNWRNPEAPTGHLLASGSTQTHVDFLWHFPEDSTDERGMGHGLTYAWDPMACAQLLEMFSENLFFAPAFVSCDSLRTAMSRAFASWSAHHPLLHFEDVSAVCDTAPRYVDDRGRRGCKHAEIYITFMGSRPADSSSEGNVASTDDTRAAVAYSFYGFNAAFRHTNGAPAARAVYEVKNAEVGFNPNFCWYLDSTFCSYFHELKTLVGAENLLVYVRLGIFALWGLVLLEATLCTCRLVSSNVAVTRLAHKSGTRAEAGKAAAENTLKWARKLDRVSRFSPCAMVVRLTLLSAPALFYWKAFLPCYECFDFENAATHEIGHVLGLAHPDQAIVNGRDLRVANSTSDVGSGDFSSADGGSGSSSYDCLDPWSAIIAAPPSPASAARNSVMWAFSANPRTPCVEQDDLEALNVLYPACGASRIDTPQCFKAVQYLGFVRLAIYVGGPVAVVFLSVMLLHQCAMLLHRRERRAMVNELADARNEIEMLKTLSAHNRPQTTRRFIRAPTMRLPGASARVHPTPSASGAGGAGGRKKWQMDSIRPEPVPEAGEEEEGASQQTPKPKSSLTEAVERRRAAEEAEAAEVAEHRRAAEAAEAAEVAERRRAAEVAVDEALPLPPEPPLPESPPQKAEGQAEAAHQLPAAPAQQPPPLQPPPEHSSPQQSKERSPPPRRTPSPPPRESPAPRQHSAPLQARPAPAFPVGTRVLVRRSDGSETSGTVDKHDAKRDLFRIAFPDGRTKVVKATELRAVSADAPRSPSPLRSQPLLQEKLASPPQLSHDPRTQPRPRARRPRDDDDEPAPLSTVEKDAPPRRRREDRTPQPPSRAIDVARPVAEDETVRRERREKRRAEKKAAEAALRRGKQPVEVYV